MLSVHEPCFYNQAKDDPNRIDAMDKEIEALEKNHTWDFSDFPPGKIPLGCKWVYRIKYKKSCEVERCKARIDAWVTRKSKAKTTSIPSAP